MLFFRWKRFIAYITTPIRSSKYIVFLAELRHETLSTHPIDIVQVYETRPPTRAAIFIEKPHFHFNSSSLQEVYN